MQEKQKFNIFLNKLQKLKKKLNVFQIFFHLKLIIKKRILL